MKKRSLMGVFSLCAALAPALLFAETAKGAKPPVSENEKKLSGDPSLHSFRPLLIQGKKRLAQKTGDMKVETGSAAESRLFFERPDFKKRIFENEDLSE